MKTIDLIKLFINFLKFLKNEGILTNKVLSKFEQIYEVKIPSYFYQTTDKIDTDNLLKNVYNDMEIEVNEFEIVFPGKRGYNIRNFTVFVKSDFDFKSVCLQKLTENDSLFYDKFNFNPQVRGTHKIKLNTFGFEITNFIRDLILKHKDIFKIFDVRVCIINDEQEILILGKK